LALDFDRNHSGSKALTGIPDVAGAYPAEMALFQGIQVMIKSIVLGSAFFVGLNVGVGLISLQSASACNRTAGCAMDTLLEDYTMMHNGKMNDAMAAGKDNIDAFRRLQEAERARAAGAGAPRR
jgi:hypothetical protein